MSLPILLEFPDRFEFERLVIRAPLPGDGAAIHAAIGESVEIWCDAGNERSAAVAERAGFELEARLRHNRSGAEGQLTDSLCFASALRRARRVTDPSHGSRRDGGRPPQRFARPPGRIATELRTYGVSSALTLVVRVIRPR